MKNGQIPLFLTDPDKTPSLRSSWLTSDLWSHRYSWNLCYMYYCYLCSLCTSQSSLTEDDRQPAHRWELSQKHSSSRCNHISGHIVFLAIRWNNCLKSDETRWLTLLQSDKTTAPVISPVTRWSISCSLTNNQSIGTWWLLLGAIRDRTPGWLCGCQMIWPESCLKSPVNWHKVVAPRCYQR